VCPDFRTHTVTARPDRGRGTTTSLTRFSPARYSQLPGMAFGGDPDRYPHRDKVVDYLLRYAAWLDAEAELRGQTGDKTAAVRDPRQ
jgi:cation diffusion facilitator CzcD-associated flavoprotein CzcO